MKEFYLKNVRRKRNLKKDNDTNLDLGLNMGLGAMAAVGILTKTMFGGITKMFGENEMPKDLAKQMMEGAVAGMLDHFDGMLESQRQEISELNKEIDKLKLDKSILEEKVEDYETDEESLGDSKINRSNPMWWTPARRKAHGEKLKKAFAKRNKK